MQPAKVDILFSVFAFGGTSGCGTIATELAFWLARTAVRLKEDPRIGRVGFKKIDTTPTTMARNRALDAALEANYDMIVMLDADNWPDAQLGRIQTAKPFMEVAFELAYARLQLGKPTMIGAPYCDGPSEQPGGFSGERPNIFLWEQIGTNEEHPQYKLGRASRTEAALMTGVHRVGAVATGVCLITMDAVREMTPPWFVYQHNDRGTALLDGEDIYFSREFALRFYEKTGENCLFLAADSWAYHAKPKWVGKPQIAGVEDVSPLYREAVLQGISRDRTRLHDLGAESGEALVDPTDTVQSAVDDPVSIPPAEESEDPPADIGPYPTADGQSADPEPSDDTPRVAYFTLGRRKIATYDDRVPSDQDLAAVELVCGKAWQDRPTARVLVMNADIGDWVAVIGALAQRLGVTPAIFTVGLAEDAQTLKNVEFESGVLVSKTTLAAVAALEPQDVDLVWLGYPWSAEDGLSALRASVRHLRPGGVLSGVGLGLDNAVTDALDLYRITERCKLVGDTSVWFATKNPEGAA